MFNVPSSAIIREAVSWADEKKYKDPQQDNMQRVRNHGTHSPNWDSPSNPSLEGLECLSDEEVERNSQRGEKTP